MESVESPNSEASKIFIASHDGDSGKTEEKEEEGQEHYGKCEEAKDYGNLNGAEHPGIDGSSAVWDPDVRVKTEVDEEDSQVWDAANVGVVGYHGNRNTNCENIDDSRQNGMDGLEENEGKKVIWYIVVLTHYASFFL